MDCLVNVLEKVGMRSLLLDAPFVCKSWYRASLHPSCWQSLIFIDTETKMDLKLIDFGVITVKLKLRLTFDLIVAVSNP